MRFNKLTRLRHWFFIAGCRCQYCNIPLHRDDFEMEHIVPRSVCKSDALDNITIACPLCNAYKSDANLSNFDEIRAYVQMRRAANGHKPFWPLNELMESIVDHYKKDLTDDEFYALRKFRKAKL
jgi:hypothetical protein